MGLFITFEGIEGCGKTTQLNLAAKSLTEKGYDVLVTAEPGGTDLGKSIREILLGKNNVTICPEAELLLFMADRAQHVKNVIIPALAAGKMVLCDRFLDATIAYQGYGRGLEVEAIRKIYTFISSGLYPDLTLLFDLEVEEGFLRLKARNGECDRFEREDRDFHHRVRRGYLTLAQREPKRFHVVNASRDVIQVHKTVMALVEKLCREKGYGLPSHLRS
ncbi:MAG: dTMP kinase [Syntrophales bacterium]|nr:dTMP kinase [Syntrophales bacterium]